MSVARGEVANTDREVGEVASGEDAPREVEEEKMEKSVNDVDDEEADSAAELLLGGVEDLIPVGDGGETAAVSRH